MKPLPQLFASQMRALRGTMDLLINTAALARCKNAPSIAKVFQHFSARYLNRAMAGLTTALLLLTVGSAFAATHYVDVNSTNATPPYTNWPTAATNIQDAVAVAVAGDEVVATNGIYAGGGDGLNRVSVGKRLTVRSVNGAGSTIVDGRGTVRCAALSNDATLTGFTLTNGVSAENDLQGGGGALGGRLNNCTFSGNRALGGGGGGACGCTLYNCVLTGNLAVYYGGGADSCTLYNCTVTGNSTDFFQPLSQGGGASFCAMYNCILYHNTAPQFPNYDSDCRLYSCCTTPQPDPLYGNSNNIVVSPLFVNEAFGNLRLQSNSSCINAGNNSCVTNTTDLDGNPRIVGGTVDIGAYEYQSLSLINFGVVSNQAGFNITGQSNQSVIVEASTNLVNWSPLVTNTLNGHPLPFSDPTPTTMPRRFYRAQAQ